MKLNKFILHKKKKELKTNMTENNSRNKTKEFSKINLSNNKQMKAKHLFPKMYEIPLIANCFSVHNGMLLASNLGSIKVYRFDNKITLSLFKSFTCSALVFLERYLSKPAVILMYKIALDLICKNVRIEEIEQYLTDLMDHLSFYNIVSVDYSSQLIAVRYKNGEVCFLDSTLAQVDVDTDEAELSIKEDKKMDVKTVGNSVVVEFDGVRILKKIVGDVIAIDTDDDKVFLLLKDNLIAISLNE